MIKDKDIKIQINEYNKLPDEFVLELLIEKLHQSWTNYKQQLKHIHMSLTNLITHHY